MGRLCGWSVMRRQRLALDLITVAGVTGLLTSGAVLWIAFKENPQGEFFNPANGAVEFGNVLPLFLTSFLVSALAVLAIEWGVYWLTRVFR